MPFGEGTYGSKKGRPKKYSTMQRGGAAAKMDPKSKRSQAKRKKVGPTKRAKKSGGY